MCKKAGFSPFSLSFLISTKKNAQELASDPKQKRKAQNRAAQRAFRERKEKYVAELQERIRQLEQQNALSEDLIKENEALKEKVRQLQEENYALKGAQFTFEFPIGSSSSTDSKLLSTESSSSPTITLDHSNNSPTFAFDNNSGSSFTLDQSSSPSNSLDHQSSRSTFSAVDHSSSSSDEGQGHSPQSLDINREIEQTDGSGDKTTNANAFSPIPASQDLEFLAVPGPENEGYVAPANFDLFQSKDSLFSDYRVPVDDFWSHTDSLSALFGSSDADLFGLNAPAPFNPDQEPGALNALDSSSYQLPAMSAMTPKQQKVYKELQEYKSKGMRVYEVREEFEKNCPEFNIDELCDELKAKATCSLNKDVVTDHDINLFLHCF